MSKKPAETVLTRPALAPGILGAIVLIAGLALLESDGFTFIRFGVTILAAIVGYFALQAKQWWWLIGLVPVVVLWNPVYVIELHGQLWVAGQYAAALLLIASGIMIKIRREQG